MAGKRYLAIETSSPRLSLALGDERRIITAYTGPHQWRHAESLFTGLEALLRKVRWTVQSLSGVAVSIGPGSFTGIRIGLACARALGQSLKIPVVGISSLEILAAGARTKAPWRAPQIDALRGQFFGALFKKQGVSMKRVISERMQLGSDWPKLIRAKAKREAVWSSSLTNDFPQARVLLELARERLARAGQASYQKALPLYIRRSSAEERKG